VKIIICTNLCPFLSTLLRFLKPSYTFLHIWLCKLDWNKFINFINLFVSCGILTCFENHMTKKLHWKLSSKFKTSHLTIDLKAIIVIFKFEPWSSTCKQWFFFLNPYWLKKIVRLLAKDWLVAYVVSKKPIIICLSCQSHPKRLMTSKYIMCPLGHS